MNRRETNRTKDRIGEDAGTAKAVTKGESTIGSGGCQPQRLRHTLCRRSDRNPDRGELPSRFKEITLRITHGRRASPFSLGNTTKGLARSHTRTHTHIDITGLLTTQGKAGRAVSSAKRDFSPGSTDSALRQILRPTTESLASARTVLLVHTVRAGQS